MIRFILSALAFSISILFSTFSFAQSDGMYEVQGRNTVYGEYSGRAWVHGKDVQRVIQFRTFRFRQAVPYAEYSVDTVWTGSMSERGPKFQLAMSNVLTSFEGFTPTPEALNAPIVVTTFRDPGGKIFRFDVPNEGSYQEVWRLTGPATEIPLWVNLRKKIEGVGKDDRMIIQLAGFFGITKVINWYRSQPETERYRNRPEFRDEKQYFIQDRTDADFYATNARTLRIANKTLNPLAFAEAMMRRNAYGPTLLQKADFLSAETFKNNLNSAGLLEVAVMNKTGQKVGRVPEYDAALWSGMLAWSEVLRYQATRDPEALQNFKKILNGVLTLVEITGDANEFARTIAISAPQENLGEGWVQGKGPYAHLKWRKSGNNDMVKGLFATLILAYKVLPHEDPEFAPRIRAVARGLKDLKPASDRSQNEAIARGINALWNGDDSEIEFYTKSFINLKTTLSDALGAETGIYYGGIADWSGIHLSMVSTLLEITVTQELEKTFRTHPEAWKLAKIRGAAEDRLFEMQKNYRAAHRDFLTIMTFAFAPRTRNIGGFVAEAQDAVWTLKEVPAPRNVGAGVVDLALRNEWSLSAWPRVPWKVLKGPFKLQDHIEFRRMISGAYGYPQFEVNAWYSTYLWKDSPFTVAAASEPDKQSFSSDYLFVYWAARASGLVSPRD